MQKAFATRILLLILASFALPRIGIAKDNRFSQLSFNLNSPRQYEWDFDRRHNAVILFIKNTAARELNNVDTYDESTLKRIVVRELGQQGTELKLYLRDKNLRAMVAHFHEPFRINIDIFDRSYKEEIDPETGLPLIPSKKEISTGSGMNTYGSTLVGEQDFAEPAPRMIPKPKYQLVQPVPPVLKNTSELPGVNEVKTGPGGAWDGFPIYIYRLQAVNHLSDETQREWMNENAKSAESSPEAMAEYAGKLFDFGNERKALAAYQQVLKSKPSIFQKAPLHLWRLAESNLGSGNANLADGYYAQFVSLFPQSKLFALAKLRRLDIMAIKASKAGDGEAFKSLASQVEMMKGPAESEFQGLKAIRHAYWSNPQSNFDDKIIPNITAKEYQPLDSALAGLESFKTHFLARTLLLYNKTHENHPWKASTGQFAADYFRRYRKFGNEHYIATIKDRLRRKLENTVAKLTVDKKFAEVIALFEALPKSMQSIRKTPLVSWFIAESYRKMGQGDKSIDFYEAAAKGADSTSNKFKAALWYGLLASRAEVAAAGAKRRKLRKQSKEADQSMKSAWGELDGAGKSKVVNVMQSTLEEAVNEDNALRTPAKVLLESWDNLASKASTPNNDGRTQSDSIKILSVMARKFKAIGDQVARQKTINLIKMLRPSQFEGDVQAKSLWTSEIVSIAEEMRLENNLLEAGRLYVLAGSESENFENRAETLYKGGLLLYRSGRRQEAIEALRKASEDGDNQFYANLAKERLNRMSN